MSEQSINVNNDGLDEEKKLVKVKETIEATDYNNLDAFKGAIGLNPTWRFLPKNNQRRLLVKFLKKETINQLIEIHNNKQLDYFNTIDLKEFFNHYNVFEKLSEFFTNIETGWFRIYRTDKMIPTINFTNNTKNKLQNRLGSTDIRVIYDIYDNQTRGKNILGEDSGQIASETQSEYEKTEDRQYYNEATLKKIQPPLNAILKLYINKLEIENKTILDDLNDELKKRPMIPIFNQKKDNKQPNLNDLDNVETIILLTCDKFQDETKIYYAKISIKQLFVDNYKPTFKYIGMMYISKDQKEFFPSNKSFKSTELQFTEDVENFITLVSEEKEILDEIRSNIKLLNDNNSINYLSNKLNSLEEEKEGEEAGEEEGTGEGAEEGPEQGPEEGGASVGGGIFRRSDNIEDKKSGFFYSKKNLTNQDKKIMIELMYYLTYAFFSVFKKSFVKDRKNDTNNKTINDDERKQLDVFFKPFITEIMSFLKNNYRLINNNSIIILQSTQFLLDFIGDKLDDIFDNPQPDSTEPSSKQKLDFKSKLKDTAAKKKYFNSLVFFNTYNKKIMQFILKYINNIDMMKKLIKSSDSPGDRASKFIDHMDELFGKMVYYNKSKEAKIKEDKKIDNEYTKILTALFPKSGENFNIKKINSSRFDKIIDESLNMDQLMFNLDNIIKELFKDDDNTLKVDTDAKTLCLDFNTVTFEEKRLNDQERKLNKSKIEKLEKELAMLRKLN